VKSSRTLLLLFFLICAAATEAQDLKKARRSIYSAKRKITTELNRTKRDVRGVDKMLSSSKRTMDSSMDTADVITWKMKPYIPNSGMIHDYQYVYSFLHSSQEYTFQKDYNLKSIHWDSINNVFYKNIGSDRKLKENAEVIGWHPHWMGDAYKYYNYKLLSMISFYSYDINPNTGNYWNPEIIDQLRKSSIADSAAKYGTKALISVTSLGLENNKIFLNNDLAQEQFFLQIIELLNEKEGKFSGIDLDFEELDPSDRDKFTQFVKKLSARLSSNEYFLILDVPYFNNKSVYDYKALSSYVKYFNIMGYDFSGEHSTYPGSISPLRSLDTQPSLETAVNDFLNIPIGGEKLILSLPLYGSTWDVTGIDNGMVPEYENSIPYYKIVSDYETEYNPYYDALSGSFFLMMQEGGNRKMCWYESDISLNTKFQWARGKNLKGIGLWALGYDQGAPEIWKVVADNFATDSLVAIKPIKSELSGPYGVVKEILTYKKVIGVGFLVVASFIVLGFIFSLTDWRVREILFQKESFRVVYSLIFLIFSIVGIEWLLEGSQWNLTLGLIVGAIGVLLINIAFTKYRDVLK
jgi:spore germination protein YaaH